jgi:hypothetical protein
MLLQQVAEQAAYSYALQFADIHANGLGAGRSVAPRDSRRNGLVAGNYPIEELTARVAVNGAHMIGERVL